MASNSDPKDEPKDDELEVGPEVAAAASSYELKCPICLEDYDNKAFVNVCFHAFCYVCIVQWSEVSNKCPMCKVSFKSLIYDVKTESNYKTHIINPSSKRQDSREVSINEARRFRYRTTVLPGERQPLESQRHRLQQSRKPATEERRRTVYQAGMRALPFSTEGKKVRIRNISASFFKSNPAAVHRLLPWLSRDIKATLGEEHVEFMIQLILSIIDKINIDSDEFIEHLRPFFHHRTEHFVHEFISFAKSPLDMTAYDHKVSYGLPSSVYGAKRLGTSSDSGDVKERGEPSQGDCDEPVAMEDASITDTSSLAATTSTTNTSGISDSITVTVPDFTAAAVSSESSSIVDTTSITPSLPILNTTVNVTQSSSSQSSSAPTDIAKDKFDKPVQPEGITFPSRMFGSNKRSFQHTWYSIFPWLEYSIQRDSVYCFPCRLFGVNPDPILTVTGFSDWKHGKGKRGTLNIHDSSHKHRAAVLSWKDFQSTNENNTSIANQLERGRKKVIKENRQYVLHLFEVILCCAQQGIPLRGHREVEHDDSSINVGNFLSFFKLHSRHIELLQSRMTSGPKNATLLSHDYQNSMLSILAKSALEYIINEVKEARYFTIMVDETKDISKKEQLTLILRYVLKGVIHERFISYSYCEELTAAALTSYIYDVLTKNGLNIADCVSQCYDGASVMSGSLTGVCTRILEDNPKAVYIHCHAHQLNLVLVDCCRSVSYASDFFALLESLYVFMSSSVPHSVLLKKQKELKMREMQLVKLSDTRWSCRHASIKAVKTTITAIIAALEEMSDDSGARAIEARGLFYQVKSFSFLLSLTLFEKIFSITGNLCNLLQSRTINYAAAALSISATKASLETLRSETEWQQIWDSAVELAENQDVTITPLQIRSRRQRQPPTSLSHSVVGTTIGARDNITEYRTSVYYAAIDNLLGEFNNRFSETNLSLLKSLQSLVPSSTSFLQVSSLLPFLRHYEIDVDGVTSEVITAATFLKEASPLSTMHHVYAYLYEAKECFPHLLLALQVAMTIGVTTASAERSFSSLRRIKSYLRSTMSQERLNNVSLLHIERDISNRLWDNLEDVVIKFAQAHPSSKVILQ